MGDVTDDRHTDERRDEEEMEEAGEKDEKAREAAAVKEMLSEEVEDR